MENPPLWVWAIVVGIIIASKFIYRWQATRRMEIETLDRKSKDGYQTNSRKDVRENSKSNGIGITKSNKYSPKFYYKDIFDLKKKKKL